LEAIILSQTHCPGSVGRRIYIHSNPALLLAAPSICRSD
jgi:hypothetical protein